MSGVSLYFHIPFCTKKCDYCHFYVIPDKERFKPLLLEGLEIEWSQRLPSLKEKQITSIYFGGGTPYLFGADRIGKIIDWVRNELSFVPEGVEITLEANPENITKETMQAYANAGINRVSIGVQTLDNSLLPTLGRLHDSRRAIEAVNITASCGISNISIDLMYDLPGQTFISWQKTLKQAVDLPITHLSLYNLTIEPHTVFFKKQEEMRKIMPDEETSLHMYEQAIEILTDGGLKQYEISAFARNNHYSRHNVGYWTGRSFLGLGPSAFSYWKGSRFRNIANLNRYHQLLLEGKSPVDFEEMLPKEAHLRELLAINIRLIEGVDLSDFQTRYGMIDHETKESLKQLEQQGLISSKGSYIFLTKKGVLFYDTVATEII